MGRPRRQGAKHPTEVPIGALAGTDESHRKTKLSPNAASLRGLGIGM